MSSCPSLERNDLLDDLASALITARQMLQAYKELRGDSITYGQLNFARHKVELALGEAIGEGGCYEWAGHHFQTKRDPDYILRARVENHDSN